MLGQKNNNAKALNDDQAYWKTYIDNLYGYSNATRNRQLQYAPGLKGYDRDQLEEDYKSLLLTPKERMEQIPDATKKEWTKRRVANNLAYEKLLSSMSPEDQKIFKKSDIRNQIKKIRNRENHFQKLYKMTPTELNAYFLKRARMSKVRNEEKRQWEVDFLADLSPEQRYAFYKAMHKSPRYIQALQDQHGVDGKSIADYPISQMELWYGKDLKAKPYYRKQKKSKDPYTKSDAYSVMKLLKEAGLDGDIPKNIEQIMAARKLAYEERQRQWQAARAVKHDAYMDEANNRLAYEAKLNNMNAKDRNAFIEASLKR